MNPALAGSTWFYDGSRAVIDQRWLGSARFGMFRFGLWFWFAWVEFDSVRLLAQSVCFELGWSGLVRPRLINSAQLKFLSQNQLDQADSAKILPSSNTPT